MESLDPTPPGVVKRAINDNHAAPHGKRQKLPLHESHITIVANEDEDVCADGFTRIRDTPTIPHSYLSRFYAGDSEPSEEQLEQSLKKVVRHEVALPQNHDYVPLLPGMQNPVTADPARRYPFILDPFQAMAMAIIEREQSVLVSAHTSAGKTVIAE